MAGTNAEPRTPTVLQQHGFGPLIARFSGRHSLVAEARYCVVTLAVIQTQLESAEHGRVVDLVERSGRTQSQQNVSAGLVIIGGEDRPGLHSTPVQATPPHLPNQQSGLTNVYTFSDFA